MILSRPDRNIWMTFSRFLKARYSFTACKSARMALGSPVKTFNSCTSLLSSSMTYLIS